MTKSILACLFAMIMAGALGCGADQPTQSKEPPVAEKPVAAPGEVTLGDRSYPTITFQNLVWIGRNLDVELPDSWCYDNQPGPCPESGRLYRWPAAQEACRSLGEGWRLPTKEEWQQLALAYGGFHDWFTDEVFGDPVEGNRNLLAAGQSGFNAQLNGWRGSGGGFDSQGKMGFYWTATPYDEATYWLYLFSPAGGKLSRRQANPAMGMSCRCVREQR